MRRYAKRLVALAVLLVIAGVAVGIGFATSSFGGIYSLPLPGGANLGPHPYTVTAVFANAVDLVPKSTVRVNDVAVGNVTSLTVPPGSWNATVTMEINGDVRLPANAMAEVTETSLLGEQYVALAPEPGVAATGRLANGATIPLTRTTTNATVEEVLGALSLLLNGGGLAQFHTITTELNAALSGNETQIRSALTEIDGLVANLDAHRTDIVSALNGLNQLGATLRARDQQIGYVLDDLTPGLQVLNQQRGQLVTMLNSLHSLSTVAVSTINASQKQTVTDLTELQPILRNLNNAGKSLPEALQVLFTFPFPDQVLKDVKGGYLNAFLNDVAQKGTCVYAPLVPGNPNPVTGQTCPTQP
jgi:phospholipid/cholesterol/gamma-HCH transport system substrate-binding protein